MIISQIENKVYIKTVFDFNFGSFKAGLNKLSFCLSISMFLFNFLNILEALCPLRKDNRSTLCGV